MAFYAFYVALYAQIAVGITFMPLWLKAQGLSEATIGTWLAAAAIIAVVINPLVGTFADRTRLNKAILVTLIICASNSRRLRLTAVSGVFLVALVFLVYRALISPLVPAGRIDPDCEPDGLPAGFRPGSRLGLGLRWSPRRFLCGFLVDWFRHEA